MNKLNQVLAVALLVQMAIIALVTVDRGPKMLEPTKVFAEFDQEKVTRFKVWAAPADDGKIADPVSVEKAGSTWGIPGADGYPADAEKVKTFLDNVGKLTARGQVVTDKAYHRKLEVAADKFQRKVTLTHDGKELTFFLGSSPSFKKLHLRKDGTDDVVLVSGLTAWDVGTDARGWVDTSYVKIPKTDVWALSIKDASRSISLERGAGDQWALLGDTSGKAVKATEVDALLNKATTVALQEPIGKTVKPEHGLEPAAITVSMLTGTSTIPGMPPKATKTQTLRIGTKTKINDVEQYFIKYDGSPYVVTAPLWAVDALVDKKPADLLEQ